MLNMVQVVSFIERAALWRSPPIFYPCVLELMNEPEKVAETGRHLKELLGYPNASAPLLEDTEPSCKFECQKACMACSGRHAQGSAAGSCLLRRCIHSRAAASLLVSDYPADCVFEILLLLCCWALSMTSCLQQPQRLFGTW